MAFAVTQISALFAVGGMVDVLRIGAWYAFLLMLAQRPVTGGGVADARRLVAAGPSFDSAVKGQKSTYGLEQVGLELKRQCEYWEKCEAAQKALADVEKPVLEVSRQVSGHRQQAQKQMDAALGLLRQPAGWLSVSLSFGR